MKAKQLMIAVASTVLVTGCAAPVTVTEQPAPCDPGNSMHWEQMASCVGIALNKSYQQQHEE